MEKLNLIKAFVEKNRGLIFCIFLILFILIFSLVRKSKLKNEGIYTITKMGKYESDASGSSLHIEVFFKGDTINTVVNSSCFGCDSKNKFYFVKLLKGNPKFDILFLEDFPVPDCILSKEIPANGWKEIPECK